MDLEQGKPPGVSRKDFLRGAALTAGLTLGLRGSQSEESKFPDNEFMVGKEFKKFYKQWGGEAVLGVPISHDWSAQGEDVVFQAFENVVLEFNPHLYADVSFSGIVVPGEEKENILKLNQKGIFVYPASIGWDLYLARPDGSHPLEGDPDWVKRGDIEIVPVFIDFVDKHGGEEFFGVPISSIIQTRAHRQEQWFTRTRLVSDGKNVFLAPLGEEWRDFHNLENSPRFRP